MAVKLDNESAFLILDIFQEIKGLQISLDDTLSQTIQPLLTFSATLRNLMEQSLSKNEFTFFKNNLEEMNHQITKLNQTAGNLSIKIDTPETIKRLTVLSQKIERLQTKLIQNAENNN